jgi:hypothetical protein
MKRSDIYPSKYIKATDITADGQDVTISSVTLQEVGEDRETKPVIMFEELNRGVICNRTNWDSIADITGAPDSDDWQGRRIKLYRAKVPFGSKTVEAVRIEAADAKPRRSLPLKKPKPAEIAFDI